MRGKPEHHQRTFDLLVENLGVALDVVDHAQPIPHRVDELAVDELAPAGVDARRGLAGFDQQTQALTPGVAAEVVETGSFAGPCNELVHT